MDDASSADDPLPFYTADPRCVFDVSPAGVDGVRRKVRRSLAAPPARAWSHESNRAFDEVLLGCRQPRPGDVGAWLTPRMARLYRGLHGAGFAHSFELWSSDRLIAGVLGVVIGRAAMLESMFHTESHSGNVNLVRTLERLAGDGVVLCDIQLPTEHTLRLGAQQIPAAVYAARLASALGGRPCAF